MNAKKAILIPYDYDGKVQTRELYLTCKATYGVHNYGWVILKKKIKASEITKNEQLLIHKYREKLTGSCLQNKKYENVGSNADISFDDIEYIWDDFNINCDHETGVSLNLKYKEFYGDVKITKIKNEYIKVSAKVKICML